MNLSVKKWLYAFIPRHVGNKAVVGFLNFLRKIGRAFSKKYISSDYLLNCSSFPEHKSTIKKAEGYIEDQNSYVDMRYGKATMQYSGCEIFATYNALFSMYGRNAKSLPSLIREYERDGIVLSGIFGTAPSAIWDFFKRHGFRCCMVLDDKSFDRISNEYETFILTMYNDRNDITKEIHTVNISKNNCLFTAHNVYCNGIVSESKASITQLINSLNNGNAKPISLIGISRR